MLHQAQCKTFFFSRCGWHVRPKKHRVRFSLGHPPRAAVSLAHSSFWSFFSGPSLVRVSFASLPFCGRPPSSSCFCSPVAVLTAPLLVLFLVPLFRGARRLNRITQRRQHSSLKRRCRGGWLSLFTAGFMPFSGRPICCLFFGLRPRWKCSQRRGSKERV